MPAHRPGVIIAIVLACAQRVESAPGASTSTRTHLSPGKRAFASEGNAALLTDGAYRSPNAWSFDPSHCTPASPCWAAVHVGRGATKLLVDWSYQDGGGNFDTQAWGGQTIRAYSIAVSDDSTNGRDGTWTLARDARSGMPLVVSGNTLVQRSHVIEFARSSWVKIAITSSSANEIDEIDLWDASSFEDSFFFHGDSITVRCASLRGTAPGWGEQPSFQATMHDAQPDRFPLQVGAGIVSYGASQASSAIAGYTSLFAPVRYWFLAMGTNDLCGGAAAYVVAAQAWIDAVKTAGGIPILVHPIWANDNTSYCSSNGASFNAAIDLLVARNKLRPAVPLYEATFGHSEYFDAGDVHPNAAGCAAWNRTFAKYARAL